MKSVIRYQNSGYLICTLCFALLALSFAFGSVSAAAEPEDRVTKIQKAYEGIKDISGRFVQKNRVKELKRTDTYRGSFYIKPPKMKWEFAGEKAQAIYVDNEQIIIHQKKEKQVFKAKFDKATYGQAPIALLAGFGDIRREFDVVPSKGTRIVLKPRDQMGSISRVEIRPSESGFPIRAITIIDKFSNVITITLSDVKINTGLKDSLFKFTPPKGTAVMEN
jgi:outer membrane lipoprotein carrier protein